MVEASGGNTPIEISGCAKRAFGVAITRSPLCGEFRAAANGGAINHANYRLGHFSVLVKAP